MSARSRWLPIVLGLLSAFGVNGSSQAESRLGPQLQTESLVVNDPRPLGAAVLQFERRCHCVVTYEDAKWQLGDVVDVTGQVRHAPNAPPLMVPRGGLFSFSLQVDLSATGSDILGRSLERILEDFHSSGHPGHYRLVARGRAFHVLPETDAFFDTPISMPVADRQLGEAIEAITNLVHDKTGDFVGLNGPVNMLRQRKVSGFGATNERSGDVLARCLAAGIPEKKVSWRMLYDFSTHGYGLNIHFVE